MPKFIAMIDDSEALKITIEQNNNNVVVKLDGAPVVKFNAKSMICELLVPALTAKGLTISTGDPVSPPAATPTAPTVPPTPPTPPVPTGQ